MAKNNYTKETEVSGLFLYKVKSQVVYHDFLSKDGYVITGNMFKKFSYFQMRLPFSIMISSIFYILKRDSLLAVLLGVCFYVLLELAFRLLFLKKCPVIKNFKKPEKDNIFVSYAKQFSYARLVLIVVLSMFLVFALVINQKYGNLSGFTYALNVVLTIIAFIFYILACYVCILKKKNKY